MAVALPGLWGYLRLLWRLGRYLDARQPHAREMVRSRFPSRMALCNY